eukprot:XP_765300.1 hypothetical protein [Theileria parva strain Muguga]
MSASSDKTVSLTDFDSNKVKWVGKGHKFGTLGQRVHALGKLTNFLIVLPVTNSF